MAENFDLKEELKKVPIWVWIVAAVGVVVVYVLYKKGTGSSGASTITYQETPATTASGGSGSSGNSVGTSTATGTSTGTTPTSVSPTIPVKPYHPKPPEPIHHPPKPHKPKSVTTQIKPMTHSQAVAAASAHDLAYDQRLAARGAKTGYYNVSGKYTTTGAIGKTVTTHPIIRTTTKTVTHAASLASTRTAIATAAKPKAMTHAQAVAAARAHDIAYNERLLARGAKTGYYNVGMPTVKSVTSNYKTAQAKSPAPRGYSVPKIVHSQVTMPYQNIKPEKKTVKTTMANYKTSQARGK